MHISDIYLICFIINGLTALVPPNPFLRAMVMPHFSIFVICPIVISPHLCVGFLFLILYPAASAAGSSSSASSASSITQNFVTHHLSFTHTTLSHTIFHTQLCQPPSFTRIFLNHHLSHTSLSHTICHTHLCQPPSFTNHLSHSSLSTIIFHTHLCQPRSLTHIFVTHHLSHTSLSTTVFSHTRLVTSTSTSAFVSSDRRGTWSHPPSFCVEGRGTYGTGLALVARLGALVAGDAAQLCVAGVGLGDIHLRFAWQAWHLVTSTIVCVAGVALMALGWLWWRAWVALGDIHLRFAWQVWHLVTSTFVLRGRCGTYGTGLALVAPLGAPGRR